MGRPRIKKIEAGIKTSRLLFIGFFGRHFSWVKTSQHNLNEWEKLVETGLLKQFTRFGMQQEKWLICATPRTLHRQPTKKFPDRKESARLPNCDFGPYLLFGSYLDTVSLYSRRSLTNWLRSSNIQLTDADEHIVLANTRQYFAGLRSLCLTDCSSECTFHA